MEREKNGFRTFHQLDDSSSGHNIRVEPGRSQEPEASSKSPMRVQKMLQVIFHCFFQTTSRKVEQLGCELELIWDAGVIGSGFTCYTTTPVPNLFYFIFFQSRIILCWMQLLQYVYPNVCIHWVAPIFWQLWTLLLLFSSCYSLKLHFIKSHNSLMQPIWDYFPYPHIL